MRYPERLVHVEAKATPAMPEHPILDALHRALAAAGAHERDGLEALGARSLADRIAAGVSWPRLKVDEASWVGRNRTRLLLRATDGATLHEGLGPGDRIGVRAGDHRWTGRVEDAGSKWAEVQLRGDGPDDGVVEVTRLFDPTTWRRYADALARADGHRSPLRDVLLGEAEPTASPGPTPLDDPGLNLAQRNAGRGALDANELALVHGPPGTGKTRLLAAVLRALVAEGERPWALADSNAAVDHLADRTAAREVDVVRVGNWGRMSASGRARSLRRRVETGPYGEALRILDRDLRRLGGRDDRDSRRAAGRLVGERREMRRVAEQAALESAEVIATTLGTLAWRAAHLPTARTAVVDEATQALEPAIWTAVPHVDRLILVGDPHQLGPVVQQPGNPLQRSLLERLLDPDHPVALNLPMLEVQHRMSRPIHGLVQGVYGPTYTPHPTVSEHRLVDLPGVSSTPLTTRSTLWVDTAGGGLDDRQDEATRSWENPGEADLVIKIVQDLLRAGVPAEAIGVITPYSAQSSRLAARLPSIQVASVNAFQGQEREAIICSWVRSNDRGEIGFVADPRRLTVALSRARRLWVGVGDTATLGADPAFGAALDVLATQGSLESVWEPPWSG